MADYRNVDLTFVNAGLDLNLPAEKVQAIQWRRLENVGVRTEGVMEARGKTSDFFSSSYFTSTSLGSGKTYPGSFELGRLAYVAYAGTITSGVAVWLTIHEAPGNVQWPGTSAANSKYYSVFINGIPVLAVDNRLADLDNGYSPYPPLMCSQYPPSVTRALTPNGTIQVIIDGRWKLYPELLSLSLADYQFNSAGLAGADASILHFPAFSLAVKLDPMDGTTTGPDAIDLGSGAGPEAGEYEWKVTFRNKSAGARSIASFSSDKVTDPNNSVKVSIPYPEDPQVDQIEIWRRGGTIGNSWRLVETVDVTSTATLGGPTTYYEYTDDSFDADIVLNEALDATFVEPFPTVDAAGDAIQLFDSAEDAEESLISFGPFLGQYVFWLGDPVKRSNFYWCNQNAVELSTADMNFNTIVEPGEELINGFVSGGNPFIFSRRKLYALDYGGPTAFPAFVPREIPIGQGLASKWAFAVTQGGVFFLAKDGIYLTDLGAGAATNISEALRPIFIEGKDITVTLPNIDWTDTDALRLSLTSRELFFFYKGKATGEYITLRYEFTTSRWSQVKSSFSWRLAYEMENQPDYRVVFAGTGASAQYSDDSNYLTGVAEPFSCKARTASWDAGVPTTDKEFGVLLLDFDPDSTAILLTPRYNSDLETGNTIQLTVDGVSGDRQLLTYSLGDVFKRALSLEFSWTEEANRHPKFYQGTLLFRVDEEGVVHWAHPPTALGEGAWFHLKDSYWTLKSTSTVTLTVGVDGVEKTYSLASTGGVRSKIYVEHEPKKGKLFNFKLDSASPFYLYGEESGINGKAWKTANGYQVLNPFAAAGYAQYLRTQGGT
jgi:hypothetical protein